MMGLRAKMYHFGNEYRQAPLFKEFAGVLPTRGGGDGQWETENQINDICYETVVDALMRGYQVMVFVHSRKVPVKRPEHSGDRFESFLT